MSDQLNSLVREVMEVIGDRQEDYAPPSVNHQLTADLFELWWKTRCQLRMKEGLPSGDDKLVPASMFRFTAEDVCMFNIIQKISRLANGTHRDSLLDIVGYAENIVQLRDDQRNT